MTCIYSSARFSDHETIMHSFQNKESVQATLLDSQISNLKVAVMNLKEELKRPKVNSSRLLSNLTTKAINVQLIDKDTLNNESESLPKTRASNSKRLKPKNPAKAEEKSKKVKLAKRTKSNTMKSKTIVHSKVGNHSNITSKSTNIKQTKPDYVKRNTRKKIRKQSISSKHVLPQEKHSKIGYKKSIKMKPSLAKKSCDNSTNKVSNKKIKFSTEKLLSTCRKKSKSNVKLCKNLVKKEHRRRVKEHFRNVRRANLSKKRNSKGKTNIKLKSNVSSQSNNSTANKISRNETSNIKQTKGKFSKKAVNETKKTRNVASKAYKSAKVSNEIGVGKLSRNKTGKKEKLRNIRHKIEKRSSRNMNEKKVSKPHDSKQKVSKKGKEKEKRLTSLTRSKTLKSNSIIRSNKKKESLQKKAIKIVNSQMNLDLENPKFKPLLEAVSY